jgi:hypothetical protein
MQKFPDNFNLECTDELINNKKTTFLRQGIFAAYNEYFKRGYKYFIINFSEYKPHVKIIILKELLQRFPNAVGYNDI